MRWFVLRGENIKKQQTWTRQSANDTFINVALMYHFGVVGRELAARNTNSLSRASLSPFHTHPIRFPRAPDQFLFELPVAHGTAHIESERRKKRRRRVTCAAACKMNAKTCALMKERSALFRAENTMCLIRGKWFVDKGVQSDTYLELNSAAP